MGRVKAYHVTIKGTTRMTDEEIQELLASKDITDLTRELLGGEIFLDLVGGETTITGVVAPKKSSGGEEIME